MTSSEQPLILPLPAVWAHIGHAREAISTAHSISLSDGETARPVSVIVSAVIVYAIIDLRSSPDFPLGDAIETFIRREDADHFIGEVRGDEPKLASYLRIEERELEAGGLN